MQQTYCAQHDIFKKVQTNPSFLRLCSLLSWYKLWPTTDYSRMIPDTPHSLKDKTKNVSYCSHFLKIMDNSGCVCNKSMNTFQLDRKPVSHEHCCKLVFPVYLLWMFWNSWRKLKYQEHKHSEKMNTFVNALWDFDSWQQFIAEVLRGPCGKCFKKMSFLFLSCFIWKMNN